MYNKACVLSTRLYGRAFICNGSFREVDMGHTQTLLLATGLQGFCVVAHYMWLYAQVVAAEVQRSVLTGLSKE